MKNNPQHNLDFEKNTPQNNIDEVLQTYLHVTHNAVANADQSLAPIVEAERRRQQAQPRQQPQPAVLKLVDAAPAPAPVAAESLLAPDNVDDLARQTRETIDRIYAEELDARAREEYGRAA